MLSKNLLIAIFVAACFRSSEELKIIQCIDDNAVIEAVRNNSEGIIPIYITNEPHSKVNVIQSTLNYFGQFNIPRGIQVNVTRKFNSSSCTWSGFYLRNGLNNTIPALLVMRDGHLIDGKVNASMFVPDEIKLLYQTAIQNPPPLRDTCAVAEAIENLIAGRDWRNGNKRVEKWFPTETQFNKNPVKPQQPIQIGIRSDENRGKTQQSGQKRPHIDLNADPNEDNDEDPNDYPPISSTTNLGFYPRLTAVESKRRATSSKQQVSPRQVSPQQESPPQGSSKSRSPQQGRSFREYF